MFAAPGSNAERPQTTQYLGLHSRPSEQNKPWLPVGAQVHPVAIEISQLPHRWSIGLTEQFAAGFNSILHALFGKFSRHKNIHVHAHRATRDRKSTRLNSS